MTLPDAFCVPWEDPDFPPYICRKVESAQLLSVITESWAGALAIRAILLFLIVCFVQIAKCGNCDTKYEYCGFLRERRKSLRPWRKPLTVQSLRGISRAHIKIKQILAKLREERDGKDIEKRRRNPNNSRTFLLPTSMGKDDLQDEIPNIEVAKKEHPARSSQRYLAEDATPKRKKKGNQNFPPFYTEQSASPSPKEKSKSPPIEMEIDDSNMEGEHSIANSKEDDDSNWKSTWHALKRKKSMSHMDVKGAYKK